MGGRSRLGLGVGWRWGRLALGCGCRGCRGRCGLRCCRLRSSLCTNGTLMPLFLLLSCLDNRIEFIDVGLESAQLVLRSLAGSNNSHQSLEFGICCRPSSKHLNDRIWTCFRGLPGLAILCLWRPLSRLIWGMLRATLLTRRLMVSRVSLRRSTGRSRGIRGAFLCIRIWLVLLE
jgi:hypothetical protein